MAVIVRRSAWRGSKSVEARTISSPTFQPLASSTWIEVAPALAVADSLVQVLVVVTVQVQRAAGDHDAAVTHADHDVLALDVVGEGDGRLAGVGPGFGADGQLAVEHDPLGGQLQVGVVGEAELAVDRQAAQGGGLTSSTTSLSWPMVTASSPGTFLLGQVDGVRPALGTRRGGSLLLGFQGGISANA